MYFNLQEADVLSKYQLLVGGVIPRPIAWISSKSGDGVNNLAPYSFFTVASCQPPVLSITQVLPRDLKNKDTLRNLRETKECVVNLVDLSAVQVMNGSCGNYPADIDEFTALNITTVNSEFVDVVGVANAPLRFECKLREIIEISNQPMGGSMILLDVLAVFVDDNCLVDNKIDPLLIAAVGKMGGDQYTKTTERFSLKRPIV
ncbi:MAG: flavin reductase (DIM6/NTAB) family NADH-FMN oxidoreductase RutF [Oceanospirillaceae bacterium]|jgi:flavin reductase (DIM6/NTAB) family NADH-FMN oxidoreductase RutF